MTIIREGDLYVEFTYNFSPLYPIFHSNLEVVDFRNRITITDYSENLDIDINSGFIRIGNAVFEIDFITRGMSETISIYGQFHLAVNNLLEETADV